MNLQDALDTLTDGDDLREMTRHNAADFVEATAVVVEAAKLVANPNKKAVLYELWLTFCWQVVERPGDRLKYDDLNASEQLAYDTAEDWLSEVADVIIDACLHTKEY